MLTTQEVLDLLSNITLGVGSDDETQISSCQADILTVRDWVDNIGLELQEARDSEERLNIRNVELQKANNLCMRQLSAQRDSIENISNEVSEAKQLSDLF